MTIVTISLSQLTRGSYNTSSLSHSLSPAPLIIVASALNWLLAFLRRLRVLLLALWHTDPIAVISVHPTSGGPEQSVGGSGPVQVQVSQLCHVRVSTRRREVTPSSALTASATPGETTPQHD